MERFTADDGVAIAYRQWAPEAAGPPVVLQHGFAASGALNWVAPGIVDALVAAGRHVVTVDARGHGDSDKPHDPARYGESRMAQDLVCLFDAEGFDAVDLVGYSMGAIVAVLTATIDQRIRRLVVGGIGAGVVELGGVDTRVIENGALAAALRADDPSTVADPAAQGFRAFADATGSDRLALAAQADAVHAEPIPFERITAEATVVAGLDDDLAARPEVLAAALGGARLERVPGDHLGAVGTPEFVRALLDALRG